MTGGILMAMLLAAKAETADPSVGVLVVIADQQLQTVPDYSPEPQKLTSYWLEAKPTNRAAAVAVPGLVLPVGRRFLRFGIERSCSEMGDLAKRHPDTHDCRESLVEWPVETWAQPTSMPPWRGDEGGPCRFNRLFVTFASPAVISLQEYRGASESCEPRGYSWSERGLVRRVGDLAEVALDWFLGDSGTKAYEAAAEGPFPGEHEQPCLADPGAYSAWYIRRERDRWIPLLKQQAGSTICIMEAPLEVDLPPVVIGFADPPLRWAAVKKLFPDATEAYGSPHGSGGYMVVSRRKNVVVSRWNGEVVSSLPAGFVVSVQWASGSEIESWRTILARR
jgi:hypothetical protein